MVAGLISNSSDHGLAVVNIVINKEQPLCCAMTRESDGYIRT